MSRTICSSKSTGALVRIANCCSLQLIRDPGQGPLAKMAKFKTSGAIKQRPVRGVGLWLWPAMCSLSPPYRRRKLRDAKQAEGGNDSDCNPRAIG